MNESQALRLQIWAFRNLELNYALKELGEDWRWTVALGLPDGSSRRLDGSPVSLAVAYDPRDPSPRRALLGLVVAGPRDSTDFFFKDRLRPHDFVGHLKDVPAPCLVDGCKPVVYDVLEGRVVLVF